VQLVIKVKLKPRVSRFAIQAANLRRMISGDPRIRIIETWLPYVDLLRLYASCDVLVSLHRSEGLGLHLMEAMSLGKVVVATGWSGNMDFMAADNSVLIPHELVPTASQHPSYVPEVGRDGQVWAEPDVAAAAEALRVLHGDANRRRALGAAAIRAMEERRRVMLSGATFEALEALLGRETGNVARFTAAVRRTRRTARARRPFFLLRMLDRMRARWRSQAR
jgi:glycosyltransferase involved in cell wall biosynthesis